MIVRSQRARALGDAIVSAPDFQSGGYGSSAPDPGAGIMFDPTDTSQPGYEMAVPGLPSVTVPSSAVPGLQAEIASYTSPYLYSSVSSTPSQPLSLGLLAAGLVGIVFILLIAKK